MRRVLLPLAVVLPLAACGTATSAQTSTGGPVTTAPASTKSACEAVGEAYTKSMGPFAEAVTKLGDGGTADERKQAQQKLGAFATSVRTATATSADPQIKTDGAQTADTLKAKSADAAVFAAIKTPQDVGTLLGPTLKEWLSPVTRHCS
jgi:hypothetical protein